MCAQGTRAMGFMDMTQEAEWSLCTRHNSRGCMDSDQGPAAVAAHPPVPCCIPAVHISLADSEYVHRTFQRYRRKHVKCMAHNGISQQTHTQTSDSFLLAQARMLLHPSLPGLLKYKRLLKQSFTGKHLSGFDVDRAWDGADFKDLPHPRMIV
eukprot:scaffold217555_cov21-Tisochrysis_lutea.AAC.1